MTATCRLCGADATYLLSQQILGTYEVKYFMCPVCDLIQTEHPYWLDHAYSSAISACDTGAIHRNIFCTRLTVLVATLLRLDKKAKYLDYGGGHGVFTRMMRDAGWEFTWSDKYGENIFARGFEGSPDQTYQLVTTFEVFEHLVDVKKELTRIFAPGHGFVLVSTILHNCSPSADWWYFARETGQHVAFYSPKTLHHIGNEFGYTVIPGDTHSLFVRADLMLPAWKKVVLPWILSSAWLAYGCGSIALEVQRSTSLTQLDHLRLRKTSAFTVDPKLR